MTVLMRAVTLLLSLAVVVALASCGDSDEPATTQAPAQTTPTAESAPPAAREEHADPAVPRVTIRDDRPLGAIVRLEVDKGETVRFAVESDEAHEVHVHGYDVKKAVPAGGRVTFSFVADIEGVFEIEAEGPGVQIASLTVQP